MDDELLKKAKSKRIRSIAIAAVVILFAASLIIAINVRQAREDKEATSQTVAENTSENASDEASENASDNAPNNASDNASDSGKKTVTIEINCSELTDHMDKLRDEGLAKYVPDDGVILGETKYTFEKSATVYDALKKVCRDNDIHYIQETGAGYSGVYISSIGHLAEFDGGKNSGWMYKVNGKSPNVGCSEYDLNDGDKILWYYTVNYNEE